MREQRCARDEIEVHAVWQHRLAWDHDLCRAVVGVTMRAVLGWLRGRARLDGVQDGRGGAVAIVQRFGGAVNLNATDWRGKV